MKFIAIQSYFKNQEKSQVNKLTLQQLKKEEEEEQQQQKPLKLVEGKNSQ